MRKVLAKMDIWLLILMIIFSLLGLIMIFSASSMSTVLRYNVEPYYFFIRQAIFLGISFILGLIILIVPFKYYKYAAVVGYIAIIISLIGLFLYGKITNNALSWYDLGFFSFQPSEFAKSIIIIFLASAYNILDYKRIKNFYVFLIPVALSLIVVFLIILQPDLGTALILLAIIFGIFISIPFVKQNIVKMLKIGVGLLIVLALAFAYSGSSLLNSRQLQRFQFLNPCSRYTEDTGYQVCNGYIAIHNGGLFGVGLGNSSQKSLYLPESHTDFIFPIIVEELGLIVGILIIIGYIIMLYRILKIAKSSQTLQLSILAYGVFLYLLFHILINLMGILALIPLTGVPLPFLSYGGSFTINVIVMLFVVQKVSIENNNIKVNREMAKIVG